MNKKKQIFFNIVVFAMLIAAATAVMAAGLGWKLTASPSPGSTNFLSGVAASSATDAWAVGYDYDAADHQLTITEHWDGNAWSRISSPNPGTAKRCGDPTYAG